MAERNILKTRLAPAKASDMQCDFIAHWPVEDCPVIISSHL